MNNEMSECATDKSLIRKEKSCKGLFETPDNSNTTSGCPNMMADELELKGNASERNNLNCSDTLMVSELTVISGEKN